MKLYFGNNKERKLICTTPDIREIHKTISKLMDEWGWECDYTRVGKTSNTEVKLDVGSWSYFFYVVMEKPEEMNEWY